MKMVTKTAKHARHYQRQYRRALDCYEGAIGIKSRLRYWRSVKAIAQRLIELLGAEGGAAAIAEARAMTIGYGDVQTRTQCVECGKLGKLYACAGCGQELCSECLPVGGLCRDCSEEELHH